MLSYPSTLFLSRQGVTSSPSTPVPGNLNWPKVSSTKLQITVLVTAVLMLKRCVLRRRCSPCDVDIPRYMPRRKNSSLMSTLCASLAGTLRELSKPLCPRVNGQWFLQEELYRVASDLCYKTFWRDLGRWWRRYFRLLFVEQVRYSTNRLHFSLRVYCDRSHKTKSTGVTVVLYTLWRLLWSITVHTHGKM